MLVFIAGRYGDEAKDTLGGKQSGGVMNLGNMGESQHGKKSSIL